MAYVKAELRTIYDRTAGRCHLCRKTLSIKNYASMGEHGAWEIDHSNPRANGGTDRITNLLPACISCNRSKQKKPNRAIREALHGHSRRPLSRDERKEARVVNAFVGASVAAAIGAAIAGRRGAVLGGLIGVWMGHKTKAD